MTAALHKPASPKSSKRAAPAARINARFSAEDTARVQALAEATHMSTSEVLREAVREYHAKHIKPKKNAYEIMRDSGFIGCMTDAPPDLSTRYKEYIAEDLLADYEKTQHKIRK